MLNQQNLAVNIHENPAAKELWAYVYLAPRMKPQTPLVLVLPILGGQNLWIERRFARALNRRGLAAAILILPQQFERRYFLEIASGKFFLGRDPKNLALNFKQALLDISTFLDWTQKEGSEKLSAGWKPKKFGLWGTSLGGILGSLAMSRDSRFASGAFALAGADPATILWEGSDTKKIASKINISRERAAGLLKEFDLYELAAEKSSQELWQNRPVILIEGLWDTVIPKSSRKKLRDSIPHARLVRLPSGHYTAILHMLWIKGRIARFLEENLE